MRRRTFLKGAAAGLGLSAAGSATTASGRALANLVLPSLGLDPPSSRTPVEHLVVLMMENRSVDHYLGWYNAENPAFDARQTAAYPDAEGNLVSTRDWGAGSGQPNYHGRGHPDPDHGWNGGRHERNGGACDGWLDPRTGNDEFALSCYGAVDLPVWAQLTRGYQTYDRWFCGVLGPTYPNRYYLHSATAGGMKNNDFPPEAAAAQSRPEWIHGWDWPTIWTLMDRAGMSSGYYFSNLPALGLWGERHADKGRHISQFYDEAAAGTLPQVSYLDPWFIAPAGVANDDHPHADIRLGQGFLSDVVEAFLTSPLFRKSALVITYDEWGGFWDHVDPPQVPDDRATPADPGGPGDFGQLGFRVPSTIVSPWTATPGRVDHHTYEHTSVVRFIADNWGLPHLNTRHAAATSLVHAFGDFATVTPEPPPFTPYDAPLELLLEPHVGEDLAVSDLYRLAERGWFDGLGFRTDWRVEDTFLRSR